MALDRRPKWLFDAVMAVEAAQAFVVGLDLPGYEASLLVRSAVERQLEILGEAGVRLLRDDPTLTEQVPALRLAIGLRNRIIHGYDTVDDETVWRTVQDDLPALGTQLRAMLPQPPT
ncbi:MAG: DUF86 domain-containing protein [Proteobacteria bacterium]|nr:DUF86 domain-containing protein [Pseudomonadota bacterium]